MNNETIYVIFLLLLFGVAFLYSSVGHGGASGYLALMAIFGTTPSIMKSSALIMNICVSLISFIQFYRNGNFKWNLFLPFAFASVPASFIGALITIDGSLFNKILGAILIFPVMRLFGIIGKESSGKKQINNFFAAGIGFAIGFLSGMIGIGGGIILSPLLLLLGWAGMRETAAVSALFIFVNSVSGLAGMLSKGVSIEASIFLWIGISLAGGFTGAYFGSKKFKNDVLRKILATVLLFASVKLIFTHAK